MSGMRSHELGPCVSLTAKQYDFVIVAVGNNDLADWRDIPAKKPEDLALNLVSFARCASREGTNVLVIGMWKRRDMESHNVETVNKILYHELKEFYVAPKLKPKHFKLNDPCHMTFDGQRDLLALLNRLICTRVFK